MAACSTPAWADVARRKGTGGQVGLTPATHRAFRFALILAALGIHALIS
jgi:hypothetical protein